MSLWPGIRTLLNPLSGLGAWRAAIPTSINPGRMACGHLAMASGTLPCAMRLVAGYPYDASTGCCDLYLYMIHRGVRIEMDSPLEVGARCVELPKVIFVSSRGPLGLSPLWPGLPQRRRWSARELRGLVTWSGNEHGSITPQDYRTRSACTV